MLTANEDINGKNRLASRSRLAVITGCEGNLGLELTRQAQTRFRHVVGIDVRPVNSSEMCKFENVTRIVGEAGDISIPGRFESILEAQLLSLGPAPEVYVFHAAGIVGNAPQQPLERVLDVNFLQAVNIYKSTARLSERFGGNYRFVFFDTIGRRFITENSLNYSASKAALYVFAIVSSRFPSKYLSNTRVFLGYDDSTTNQHIRLNAIKIPTRKMVRRILDASELGRSSVSIPAGRNALILTLDRLSLLLPRTATPRLHRLLKRLFVARNHVI